MKPDCAAAFFRLPKVLRKSRGTHPKTLRILVILGLRSGYAAVAVLKRRGGLKAKAALALK